MNYVFVTGAGRCGTNLINGILDGHTKLNVFPGEVTNIFFHTLINNGYSTNFSKNNNKNIIINSFFNEINIKNKKKIKKKIFDILNKKNKISLKLLIDTIFECLYPKKKYNVINLQNENISGLLDYFKSAKIIHLIRHPYTQINSRYLLRHKQPVNYIGNDFSASYRRNYNSFLQAKMYKKNKNVLVIKVEELTENNKIIIKEICRFLKISPESKNYKLTRSNKIFVSTINGVKNFDFKIRKMDNDYSNLLPNDLYYCSKIEPAKAFYKINQHKKVRNSYYLFLLRHLGFIGKNRRVPLNPFKIIKLVIHSIYNYVSDIKYKDEFDNFLKSRKI